MIATIIDGRVNRYPRVGLITKGEPIVTTEAFTVKTRREFKFRFLIPLLIEAYSRGK